MSERLIELGELLSAVQWRWRRLVWLRAWTLGAGIAAVVLLAGLGAVLIAAPDGGALVAVTLLTLAITIGALARALWPVRRQPPPVRLARLIEERVGGLDDVLVTAVEYAERPDHSPQMARLLEVDAARAARSVDLDVVVPRPQLTVAIRTAAAAAFVLAVTFVLFLGPLHRAALLTTAYFFPARITIEVAPGDVRIAAGQPLTIVTRLGGVVGGLVPIFVTGDGEGQNAIRMRPGQSPGEYTLTFDSMRESFGYRVAAGGASSPAYTVTVVYPPRVERIDLEYEYPKALGLAPRTDQDSGDIYAPAGTRVRVAVTADKTIASGALVLDDGTRVPLDGGTAVVGGNLEIAGDGSYRVSLADTDGLENPGDTEYFIRVLNDRPPDVRIMRPAGDRQVTALEEVVIEARADDDYGIASLDLVFQTPAGRETVVPLPRTGGQTVTGRHVLHLEDLDVEPGDFVTYYARARDVGRGRRPVEARSDIFFLEVKPFEEIFRAAQSQSMSAPGGGGASVDDLAAVQKEIIVATWKLDSRARRANDAGSAQDIRTIAKAQAELKGRAEQMAGQSRAMTGGGRRRGPRPQPMSPSGDDPMASAVAAMGRAVAELDRLQTSAALPHEMEALNQLLKAQADVRERQVARQQQGGGGGGRPQPDLSSLFDQELRRNQGNNYEMPSSAETRDDRPQDDPLEELRELARRQDALNRQQRDLARNREQMEAEEVKRRLERLTRDQQELRRQAEELAKQLQQRQQAQGQRQDGQRSQAEGAQGEPSGQGSSGDRLREASQQMREAAGDLGREDPDRAMARGARALEQLREAEQQLRQGRPDERRRAAGDLQLETQQIADAQRRLANEAGRSANGESGDDARRRLAGEQERLAERADRLEDAVRRLGADERPESDERRAVDDAAREIERQRVAERMRESAERLRQEGRADGGAPGHGEDTARDVARQGEDVARALDRVAERLGAATGAQDAESRRLSEQLARTRELRDRVEDVQRSLERLDRQGQEAQAGERGQPGQPGQQQGNGQPGQAGQAAGNEAGQGSQGGRGGGEGGAAGELGRLQRDTERQMREARQLAEQLLGDNSGAGGAGGGTPEGWRPSVSAPGTEAFKQDFARWESLKAHLLLAIEQVEGEASDLLRAREARDRLNAGRHEAAPDAYREQVDRYYRSLAAPRKNPQR